MSHKIIYNCDFCGKEISNNKRYLVTVPHKRYDDGGTDEDVCAECAARIETVMEGLKLEIKEGGNDRG